MLRKLPFFRHLHELLFISRRHLSIVERFTARSDPQYAHRLISLLIDDYLERHLHRNERYADPRRLNRYEYQVFSQSGEDGIIDEIFRRIGTTTRHFVEFGVENGLETNTTSLIVKGFRGSWIEADPGACAQIRTSFAAQIATGQLTLQQAMITAENIEELLMEAGTPPEPDLLSIDIDGNDYWVWQAIERYRPRLVVIEYNATFRPGTEWIMKYDPRRMWDRSSYHGASLTSLELLGRKKGYSLVGCSFMGVNAFFVRDDLLADSFCGPFDAANHFEPARFHLWRKTGHPRGFGEFVT
jgi:hypothetical protein